ncbi:hypothetical protein [Alcaligenes endophyticus]|uniref:Uncharacterized protein n=1 Tax=Alcaligenes endophyticus TaxID=1929088 RepID=A0ABT8EKN3_9BURK|nr:hypothetical protein [Alcaligenes endophyticus]MCX5590780.1 hypothetical protein [Alcaligenes endophyticus]MDN4121857.1 hypothetical protein [Alcaligenes endophyticus]
MLLLHAGRLLGGAYGMVIVGVLVLLGGIALGEPGAAKLGVGLGAKANIYT